MSTNKKAAWSAASVGIGALLAGIFARLTALVLRFPIVVAACSKDELVQKKILPESVCNEINHKIIANL
jgi:hypothetical protein